MIVSIGADIVVAFLAAFVKDVFASTAVPSYGVRFQTSGSGADYGTLEVYQSGVWKNLCRDGFDDTEATIVCKQMGFHGGRLWRNLPGTRDIDTWIYRCNGPEAALNNCDRTTGPSVRNCSHSQDVAVQCYIEEHDPSITRREKIVRIIGGSAHDQTPAGTVEVLTNGEWRPVCPEGWTDVGACTVCHQLGYRRPGCKAHNWYGISSGYDPLFAGASVLEVDCGATIKNNISECITSMLYCTSHISHSRISLAGVQCTQPENLDYRLVVGGNVYNETYGTVEVFVLDNRYWHPLCDNQADSSLFYNSTADTACKHLGFQGGYATFGSVNGWSRAQGQHYSPVREVDVNGAVSYGDCDTTHHLGAVCISPPGEQPDANTITIKPKPKSTTKDPYYDTKYKPEEENKTSTEKLVMYLAIAAVITGLILLGCYLLKRLKCCKRRRETAAIGGGAPHPPVGMAKLGPVPGMVIIPSRNPGNRGPGAPPRSHMSTHMNHAFNPQMMGADPLGAQDGPIRPSDEAYFQVGPGVAPAPPVYHGQTQPYPDTIRGMTPVNVDTEFTLAAPGPGLPPTAPPTGVPPLATAFSPPAYDSLYPAENTPAPAPLPQTTSGTPPDNQPQKEEAPPPQRQENLTRELEDLLGDGGGSAGPVGNIRGDHDDGSAQTPGNSQLSSAQAVGGQEMTRNSEPSTGNTTMIHENRPGTQLSSYPRAQPGDLQREKTLGMDDLERMLLPTPVPPPEQQTSEL